ncbi:MAG: GFA family protein [Sphingopyxis sp.]
MVRASCLCGGIRYDLDGPVAEVILCHCTQCRRANGGAFNVGVPVDRARVHFHRHAQLREYESSPGKYRAFCGGCGAPVYSRVDALPHVLRLRGGLMADLPAPASVAHIHTDTAWHWLPPPPDPDG